MNNGNVVRIESLNLLKVIAILLIINSHFDSLYPNSIFATGGSIGNSLFFIIAGFLLNFNEGGAWKYVGKKMVNICFPTVIVTVYLILIEHFNKITIKSAWDVIYYFVWPTEFWFVGALLLFIILVYALRHFISNNFKAFTFLMILICFIYYLILVDKSDFNIENEGILSVDGFFKLIHYFYIFSLGYYIKIKGIGVCFNRYKVLALGVSSFISSFVIKAILLYLDILWAQILINITDVLFAYFSIVFVLLFEQYYNKNFNEIFRRVINGFSGISLEVYLIQFSIIRFCTRIAFPWNCIVAIVLIISIGYLLSVFDKSLCKKLCYILKL